MYAACSEMEAMLYFFELLLMILCHVNMLYVTYSINKL